MAFVVADIFCVLFIYFTFTVLYLFILSLAALLVRPKKPGNVNDGPFTKKMAILVPAYKEDGIIVSTALHHLRLNYPRELYDVYILADSFQPATLEKLRALDVQVLEMVWDKSTKIKSLNEALLRIHQPYDIAVISDADNILAPDFLRHIHAGFAAGEQVIQGRRVAKNMDTPYALLDACSEMMNNHIFRKGANAVGLSSPLIGSGTAFDYSILRTLLSGIDSAVEDKVLQLKLAERRIFILYMEDALVFDEKVDSRQAFEHQRKRWVSGQFLNLKEYFLPACRQLLKGNFSYFNYAVINNLILPRAFLFVTLPAMVVAGYFLSPFWGTMSLVMLVGYLISLLMGIPRSMFNKDLLSALAALPRAIFVMAAGLFQMKKSQKVFIHTVHTKTEISNSLFKKNGK